MGEYFIIYDKYFSRYMAKPKPKPFLAFVYEYGFDKTPQLSERDEVRITDVYGTLTADVIWEKLDEETIEGIDRYISETFINGNTYGDRFWGPKGTYRQELSELKKWCWSGTPVSLIKIGSRYYIGGGRGVTKDGNHRIFALLKKFFEVTAGKSDTEKQIICDKDFKIRALVTDIHFEETCVRYLLEKLPVAGCSIQKDEDGKFRLNKNGEIIQIRNLEHLLEETRRILIDRIKEKPLILENLGTILNENDDLADVIQRILPITPQLMDVYNRFFCDFDAISHRINGINRGKKSRIYSIMNLFKIKKESFSEGKLLEIDKLFETIIKAYLEYPEYIDSIQDDLMRLESSIEEFSNNHTWVRIVGKEQPPTEFERKLALINVCERAKILLEFDKIFRRREDIKAGKELPVLKRLYYKLIGKKPETTDITDQLNELFDTYKRLGLVTEVPQIIEDMSKLLELLEVAKSSGNLFLEEECNRLIEIIKQYGLQNGVQTVDEYDEIQQKIHNCRIMVSVPKFKRNEIEPRIGCYLEECTLET